MSVHMTPRRFLTTLAVLALACPAWALIKIDTSLENTYRQAGEVLVGKIAKVDKDRQWLEVAVVDVAKGDFPARAFRIKVAHWASPAGKAAVGDSVAVAYT